MQTTWYNVAMRGLQSAVLAALILPAAASPAQNAPAQPPAKPENEIVRTIYLHHAADQNDLNDIQTALRSALRRSVFFGVASQNAIEFRGTPEDFETAEKIVADLDRPRKTYRLTYTITSSEDGKHSGSQSFAILARLGDKTDLDLSSRVPYETGGANGATSKGNADYQWQYANAGVRVAATLLGSPGNLILRDTIDQSAAAPPKTGSPVATVSHAVLTSEASVTDGKPAVLGSIDIPGTPVHEQVEVVVTPAP
jgi:hypothetical protein